MRGRGKQMQIRVYGTHPAPVDWTALAACCAPDKYKRIHSMRDPHAQQLSAAGALLLAYALQETFGLRPSPSDFGLTGVHGKPVLRPYPHLGFNLSHSGSLVLCAVADAPVGVDIQQRISASDALARRVLSPPAYQAYRSAEDADAFFCQTWALKESYCKYTGAGLAQGLRSFTVYPDANGAVHSTLCHPVFHLLDVPDGYAAALCSRPCTRPVVHWIEPPQLLL